MSVDGRNVYQLITTATTTGSYIEVIIPDGFGGYLSRKIAFSSLKDAINLENNANKGHFVDEAALVAAYPSGENGWYAVNEDTDTIWLWDGDTEAWVNSGTSSSVVSINGYTGTVVLAGSDIDFDGLETFTGITISDVIDELKQLYDAFTAAGDCHQTHTKVTDQTGAITKAFNDGDLLLKINFQYVSGTPLVKIGTSAGGDQLYPETEVQTGIPLMANLDKGFESNTTIYITITGGLVHVGYIYYEDYLET